MTSTDLDAEGEDGDDHLEDERECELPEGRRHVGPTLIQRPVHPRLLKMAANRIRTRSMNIGLLQVIHLVKNI